MTITSIHGCQEVQMNNYWFFAERERLVFAVVGIPFSFLICFFGRVFLRASLFVSLVGTIVCVTIDSFSSLFYGSNRNTNLYWTVFLAALAGGCGVAYLLRK